MIVGLGSSGYGIYIGPGVLASAGERLREKGFSGRLVIITDPLVKELYGEALCRGLAGYGFDTDILLVERGEEHKSLETAGRLYHELTALRAERTTPVLALGGGVIGDLAGFVAATYLRGLPLVQVPTTLLAQVDSSIGGKVAVDHGRMKNMIGAFYQPAAVFADIDALKTLPPAELSNGLAEVIKSAAIRDAGLFAFLEENMERARALDVEVLEEIVYRTAGIKAGVVEKDERDSGLRGILNYGHTIGHALESASHFGLRHGSAVAIGMVAAARLSHRMGALDVSSVSRLKRLIERAGLPVALPDVPVPQLMEGMSHDKKVQQRKTRFVLLQEIGRAFISDEVPPALVEQVLAER
ncbi:MAG: 3-dehydroquinate synthase [Chloroflexi bacterium]|nr:3-dehydroquinate synthase [Chloroflexota bacterium]